jgi:hypothetical protein
MNTIAVAASLAAALTLGYTAGLRSAPVQEQRPAAKAPEQAMPTMEEMMAAMERVGTPGEQHRALDPLDPAAEPHQSKAMMTNAWIHDGHYLECNYQGDFMGAPFTGTWVLGYDIAGETYRGMWIDSMSTAMSSAAGSVSADGKTFTFQTTCTDPMTGEPCRGQETVTIEGPDKHTMTMHRLLGDEMVKCMEIVYTRVQ